MTNDSISKLYARLLLQSLLGDQTLYVIDQLRLSVPSQQHLKDIM
jgi:hypothetical protein